MKKRILIPVSVFCSALGSVAQDDTGIELGNFLFRPSASVLSAYDDRVIDGPASAGDLYGEAEAGIRVDNLPARYDLFAEAYYGYRMYDEYDGLNDDFYSARGSVASEDNPLLWDLSAEWRKTLSYDTTYDPETGQAPDSILSDDPNRRFSAQARIAYDAAVSESTTLRPEYRLTHYYQEFNTGAEAEWQIHTAALQFRKDQSEQFAYFAGASYSLQANDDEDGFIGSLQVGAEGQLTDKTSWLAEIGYAHADYDLSGTEHGVVSLLRGNWQVTEKVSAYLFGGNDFQPGYNGGAARWVYRAGYGAGWKATEKIEVKAAVLHDYQDVIGSNTSTDPRLGELRHFFDLRGLYRFTNRFSGWVGYEFTKDEKTPDRNLVFVGVRFGY